MTANISHRFKHLDKKMKGIDITGFKYLPGVKFQLADECNNVNCKFIKDHKGTTTLTCHSMKKPKNNDWITYNTTTNFSLNDTTMNLSEIELITECLKKEFE